MDSNFYTYVTYQFNFGEKCGSFQCFHFKVPRISLLAAVQASAELQQYRHRRTKHFNPKWKKMRQEKYVKVELPKMNEKFSEMTPEEQRSKMKERGIAPPRPYMERPFYIACTGGTFEPYVPP